MTTVDQEVDIFLEHFGAKGMKWGVRKAVTNSGKKQVELGAKLKKPFVKSNPNAKRNKKIAVGVGAAVLVGAGAIVARRILGANASKKASEASSRAGREFAIKTIKEQGRIRTESALKNAHKFSPGSNSRELRFSEANRHQREMATKLASLFGGGE